MPPVPARRRRLPRPSGWVLVAAVVALLALARGGALTEGDTFWQARTGLGVLAGHLPRADAYSWTVPGRAWVPNSWGFDALVAGAWRLGGFPGLGALNVALAAGLLGLLAVQARRRGGAAAPTALLLLGVGAVLFDWLALRPQLAGYLLLPAALACVRPALTGGWPRRLAAVAGCAAVHLVWVNLHFSALIGPVALAAAALAHRAGRLRQGRGGGAPARAALRAGAAVALLVLPSAAACLLTPYGPVAPVKALLVRDASVGLVTEWQPPGPGSTAQLTALALLLVCAPAVLCALRAGRAEGAAVLAVLAMASVDASRMAPLLAVVAVPELAAAASRGRAGAWVRSRRGPLVLAAAVVAAPVAAGAAGAAGHLGVPAPGIFAAAAVEAIPPGCRLLNDYEDGGLVVLARPDVPVAMDGRNDLYGRAVISGVVAALDDAPGTRGWLARERVGCVLAPTADPLVVHLSADPAWRVRSAAGSATLLVRR